MSLQDAPLDRISLLEVINGLPHGVAVVGRDGTIAEMNHYFEAFTGHAAEDARGALVDQVAHSNLGMNGKFFRKAAAREERVSLEGNIIDATRRKIPVRLTLSPLCEPTGELVFFLLSLEDLSSQQALSREKSGLRAGAGIIGHSPKMQELFELLPILAQSDTTLLITGETGTGKDLLAETIHNVSKRAKAPFVKVNCGALPETLLESELFGHMRGSFTGAHSDKPGMFKLAEGGTLYLTEIGDLPLPLQVKLLTVLDDKEFFPLGSAKKIKVDVRLIAGTHHDLRSLTSEGKFREDLFFRLNVLRAHLPPLRERGDDIKLLLEHFLRKFSRTLEKKTAGFTREAEACLRSYSFPGNVRELSNIVEYAANICQEDLVAPAHLPGYLQASRKMGALLEARPVPAPEGFDGAPAPASGSFAGDGGEAANWSDYERKKIFDTLVRTDGNRSQAAKLLGWGRTRLWRKIKLYGLE